MKSILVHIPHASVVIPPAERAAIRLSEPELQRELLRVTDWYTDELFRGGFEAEDVLEARVSRLIVDVERFPNDADEPCAALGMGAVYTTASTGQPLREIAECDRRRLMEAYYWPHHQALARAVQDRVDRYGVCTIIDAHSFSTNPLPTQAAMATLPEICLGDRNARALVDGGDRPGPVHERGHRGKAELVPHVMYSFGGFLDIYFESVKQLTFS